MSPLGRTRQQNSVATTPRFEMDSEKLFNMLRLEYGPAVIDSREVAETLLSIERCLEEDQSDIVHPEPAMAELQRERGQLEEYAKRLRSSTSPVRRLPTELLCRIFNFCCENNLLQEHPWSDALAPPTSVSGSYLPNLPAMVLSSVCVHWRLIAVALPEIWSRITLELSMTNARLLDASVVLSAFLDALELYLHRSQGHPLTLDFCISGWCSTARYLALISVGRHSDRWRSVRLLKHANFSSIADHLSTSSLSLPMLEELDLGEQFTGQDDIKRLAQAPRIRGLTMDSFEEDAIVWGNRLTSLQTVIDRNGMGMILDGFPNLTELRLWQCPVRGVWQDTDTMILCKPPRRSQLLRSLTFYLAQSLRPTDGETAFRSIVLPSLTELNIEASRYAPRTDPWPTDALNTFLRVPEPKNLTTFSIKSIVVSDSDLVAALKLMPSLTDLTVEDSTIPVHNSPITSRFIASLHALTPRALHSSASPILPKLQSLRLHFEGMDFDDEVFINAVSSRWISDEEARRLQMRCLRSVVMKFRERVVNEEVYSPLQRLKKEGMMVIVLGKRSDDTITK